MIQLVTFYTLQRDAKRCRRGDVKRFSAKRQASAQSFNRQTLGYAFVSFKIDEAVWGVYVSAPSRDRGYGVSSKVTPVQEMISC